MEVETKKQNVDDQSGPSEKQIESLLISFLNGLIKEQVRPAPSAQATSAPEQEIAR